MDDTDIANKLTIFRHALRHANETVSLRTNDLCRAILYCHKDALDDRIHTLHLDLVSATETTQELLMVLEELAKWIQKSLPYPTENSQNETNKEEK